MMQGRDDRGNTPTVRRNPLMPGAVTKLAHAKDGCRWSVGPGVLARPCQHAGWYKVAGAPGAYCKSHVEAASVAAVQKAANFARLREKSAKARKARENPHGVLYAPGTLVRAPGKGQGTILSARERYDVQWGRRTQYDAAGDDLEALGGVKVRAAATHAHVNPAPAVGILHGGGKQKVVAAAQKRLAEVFDRGYALNRKGRWCSIDSIGFVGRWAGHDQREADLTPVDAETAALLTAVVAGTRRLAEVPNNRPRF